MTTTPHFIVEDRELSAVPAIIVSILFIAANALLVVGNYLLNA